MLIGLKDWVAKGGGEVSSLELNSSSYGGLFAKKNIKAGETVILIPKSKMISAEKAYATPIGVQMLKHEVYANNPDKSIFLTIFIMQEMVDPKDVFGRYIDVIESSGYS